MVVTPETLATHPHSGAGTRTPLRPTASLSSATISALTGPIAAGVLILVDLPQPSNYGAEGNRVLWTLCGVGIGVIVMLLAWLIGKHTVKAPPQQAAQPG